MRTRALSIGLPLAAIVFGVATFAPAQIGRWVSTGTGLTTSGTVAVTSSASNALDITGGVQAGSGNVQIIDATGKIPAISSTQFTSLSGANLTGLLETNIADGSIFPRLAANESISGVWTFSNQIAAGAGSAGTPSIKFGSGGVGLFSPSITQLSVTIGSELAFFRRDALDERSFHVPPTATGTGARTGNYVFIGNNTLGSGAAGHLEMSLANGIIAYIWPDLTGVVRINYSNSVPAGAPQEDGSPSDTGGTVLGAQTSTRASKNIFGEFTDNAGALELIKQTPVWNFDYRSGAYNGQQFVGITTDDSPAFGMDNGRAFNAVSASGYTFAAIKELERQIQELKSELAALRSQGR